MVWSDGIICYVVGMLIHQYGTTRTSNCLRSSVCNEHQIMPTDHNHWLIDSFIIGYKLSINFSVIDCERIVVRIVFVRSSWILLYSISCCAEIRKIPSQITYFCLVLLWFSSCGIVWKLCSCSHNVVHLCFLYGWRCETFSCGSCTTVVYSG